MGALLGNKPFIAKGSEERAWEARLTRPLKMNLENLRPKYVGAWEITYTFVANHPAFEG